MVSGTPVEGFGSGLDPKSGLLGAKWDVTDAFTSGAFCVTVAGKATLGEVKVASKSGVPISYSTVAGPVCSE